MQPKAQHAPLPLFAVYGTARVANVAVVVKLGELRARTKRLAEIVGRKQFGWDNVIVRKRG